MPQLSLPLFQGGQLVAARARAKARYQELVADYRSAVLGAFRDVEDELSDLQLLAEKAVSLDATIAAARENSRLTEVQYRQGLTTYLQVIDANQTLLTSELSAAQAHLDRLDATVLLIKALGGGWNGSEAVEQR
jgi:multidrug efflux system outer membrane protein